MEIRFSGRCILFWQTRAVLFLLPFSFISGIIGVLSPVFLIAFCIIFIVFYILFSFFYLPYKLRHRSLTITDRTILYQNGTFFHTSTKIPCSRILYCSISQSPLQRLFGFCTLTFQPVGHAVRIQPIQKDDADFLKQKWEENFHALS